MTVEGHGKAFRGDEDTSSLHGLVGMEGEMVCYVYHRKATPEEEEALAAREARAAAARAVAAAALAVMREPGETVALGHEPEGEVVWEDDRHAIHGTRDWAVLDDEGWLWRCEYRGADGDAWGEYELGWNVRGSRVPATPERLAALRADSERTGFEPCPTRQAASPGP